MCGRGGPLWTRSRAGLIIGMWLPDTPARTTG
jgi:hypothetical protein